MSDQTVSIVGEILLEDARKYFNAKKSQPSSEYSKCKDKFIRDLLFWCENKFNIYHKYDLSENEAKTLTTCEDVILQSFKNDELTNETFFHYFLHSINIQVGRERGKNDNGLNGQKYATRRYKFLYNRINHYTHKTVDNREDFVNEILYLQNSCDVNEEDANKINKLTKEDAEKIYDNYRKSNNTQSLDSEIKNQDSSNEPEGTLLKNMVKDKKTDSIIDKDSVLSFIDYCYKQYFDKSLSVSIILTTLAYDCIYSLESEGNNLSEYSFINKEFLNSYPQQKKDDITHADIAKRYNFDPSLFIQVKKRIKERNQNKQFIQYFLSDLDSQ